MKSIREVTSLCKCSIWRLVVVKLLMKSHCCLSEFWYSNRKADNISIAHTAVHVIVFKFSPEQIEKEICQGLIYTFYQFIFFKFQNGFDTNINLHLWRKQIIYIIQNYQVLIDMYCFNVMEYLKAQNLLHIICICIWREREI